MFFKVIEFVVSWPARIVCEVGALLLIIIGRGRLVRRNMVRAYGDIARGRLLYDSWRACARTVELGLLGLVGPSFGAQAWRRRITVSPQVRTLIEDSQRGTHGVLFLVPHTTLMEALTVLPSFFATTRSTNILYRPFGAPWMERLMLAARSRPGVRMLSRTSGLYRLTHALKKGENGVILYDQNSGEKGVLISFMGALAAASDLPDILWRSAAPTVIVLAARRTGFWRGEIVAQTLQAPTTGGPSLTVQAHRWLEAYLAQPTQRTDWLWTHARWKVLAKPHERLGIPPTRRIEELPTQRRYRVWVRLPNWLGDVIMALPLLRALQASRPDIELTIIARPAYLGLLQYLGLGQRYYSVPKKWQKSFLFCYSQRGLYPDVGIALTNSTRGDIELWLTGAQQRYGLVKPGKWRPLLTHSYSASAQVLANTHQTHVWEAMLRTYGLQGEVSYAPMQVAERGQAIAFICGSANSPEKRWPVAHWRALAQALAPRPIVLFGGPGECDITQAVAAGLPHVTDRAGQTDLPGLAQEISRCALLVGNDTGATHLANAMGVPTVVLYGPTASAVTGPIFQAPVVKLQSPDGRMESLDHRQVYQAIVDIRG